MNTEELTMLLARVQVLDNRQVDQLTIEAWSPLMADLDYGEAVDAVNTHFRESTMYLQPVHVRTLVKRAKGSSQPPPFGELPRPGQFADPPLNMAAMTAAYQSGDQVAVDREVAAYEQQIGVRVHALRVGEVPR